MTGPVKSFRKWWKAEATSRAAEPVILQNVESAKSDPVTEAIVKEAQIGFIQKALQFERTMARVTEATADLGLARINGVNRR